MLKFPDAKINLGLSVISRRPDGYHDIETVMMPIPSYDILEIVESHTGEDTLHCSGRTVDCPMDKNLVYKAVMKMREHFDIPPVNIYLDKQTPDGAGLGGGSADAAFTLKALDEMFCLDAGELKLASIAGEIGADCPFFIYDRPMLCTGTGTDLSPFDLDIPAGMWLAVVKPDVSVPTREAYASLTPRVPERSVTEVLRLPMTQWQGLLVNDFEAGITARHPVVGDIRRHLLDAGAVYASMSGSGSAVFGFFSRELTPEEIKPLGREGCYLFKKIS